MELYDRAKERYGNRFSEPLYVIELWQEKNQVIVGTRQEVWVQPFYRNDLWTGSR